MDLIPIEIVLIFSSYLIKRRDICSIRLTCKKLKECTLSLFLKEEDLIPFYASTGNEILFEDEYKEKFKDSAPSTLSIRLASHNGHYEIVKFLLQKRREFYLKNNNEESEHVFIDENLVMELFFISFKSGQLKVVQMLIENFRIDMESFACQMKTNQIRPLMKESSFLTLIELINRNESIVSILLDIGHQVQWESEDFFTKFCIWYLEWKGNTQNGRSLTCHILCLTCERGFKKSLKTLLLHKEINPCTSNHTMIIAVKNQDLELLKILLEDKRITLSNDAIILSMWNHYREIVNLFLSDERYREPSCISENYILYDKEIKNEIQEYRKRENSLSNFKKEKKQKLN